MDGIRTWPAAPAAMTMVAKYISTQASFSSLYILTSNVSQKSNKRSARQATHLISLIEILDSLTFTHS